MKGSNMAWILVFSVLASLLYLGVSGVFSASGKGSIVGKTRPGAVVAIQGTSMSVIADAKTGQFRLDNVPVGVYYTVVASNAEPTSASQGTYVYPPASAYSDPYGICCNVIIRSTGDVVDLGVMAVPWTHSAFPKADDNEPKLLK